MLQRLALGRVATVVNVLHEPIHRAGAANTAVRRLNFRDRHVRPNAAVDLAVTLVDLDVDITAELLHHLLGAVARAPHGAAPEAAHVPGHEAHVPHKVLRGRDGLALADGGQRQVHVPTVERAVLNVRRAAIDGAVPDEDDALEVLHTRGGRQRRAPPAQRRRARQQQQQHDAAERADPHPHGSPPHRRSRNRENSPQRPRRTPVRKERQTLPLPAPAPRNLKNRGGGRGGATNRGQRLGRSATLGGVKLSRPSLGSGRGPWALP
mmetsp:Transcript_19975/g.60484  ORF Transcript_19975/g.60484 Transcript_19975/m.60484 type:complete len:265 (+) Transcript_19975:1264-2058(+)